MGHDKRERQSIVVVTKGFAKEETNLLRFRCASHCFCTCSSKATLLS